LIQVTGVIVINGSPQKGPKVTNPKGISDWLTVHGRRGLKPAEFGEGLCGKVREQASLEHCPLGNAL
jgi:hypothetical protein